MVVAAVTGENDVAVSGPDPGIPSGDEIDVAVVTAESSKRLWKSESIPFGDPACATDVRPREIELAVTGGVSCEVGQSLDPFCCDGHTGRSTPTGI